MSVPKNLYPSRGGDVEEYWNRALRWADSQDFIIGSPGLVLTETTLGVAVVFRPRSAWDHPFRVTASASKAQVGAGFVNDQIPRVDGVTIDGINADGGRVSIPTISISPPEKGSFSWVGVAVAVDEKGLAISPDDEPDALTIQHAIELDPAVYQGGSPDFEGVGFQPLARLDWRDGKLSRVFQIVYHNLGWRFKQGDGEKPGRHFFFAQG